LTGLEKLDYPVSHSGTSGFGSFQSRNREGAELEDLKIQGALKDEKGLKRTKGPRWKKTEQEVEVIKTLLSGFGYRSIWFSQNT
jgi:hypothetical protein